jgi:hypothetical protein
MRLTRATRAGTLRLECADSLAAHAEWAIIQIARGIRAGGKLTTGQQIQFGWSILTIVRSGTEFVVCEPDFDRDPTRDVRQDLSTTLGVQAEMLDAVRRVGAEGDFPRFNQTVLSSSTWDPLANFEIERGFALTGGLRRSRAGGSIRLMARQLLNLSSSRNC